MSFILSEIFTAGTIVINLESTTKEDVFIELTDTIAAAHPECDKAVMLSALWEREQKMSTGIAPGVAIPHAICKGLTKITGAVGISRTGIEFDAMDQKPVHVVFMLAMSDDKKENQLQILNSIFSLIESNAIKKILNAQNAEDVHAIIKDFS
ncbi:MAG: PTS sugar transporter subunit IIA [Treponema sp.]|nr:PTS sugar transporter subunit IIA [Treponema sp.]